MGITTDRDDEGLKKKKSDGQNEVYLVLSEDEIWEVVLFLYDFTGNRPRALEEQHE